MLRVASGDRRRLCGWLHGARHDSTVRDAGPIRGRLFKTQARRHAKTLNLDDFAHLAIEGEMAVRIGSDRAIAEAFRVIELHHYVFRGVRKTLPELVGNNGLHAGFVLPRHDWLSSKAYIEGTGALSVRINDRLIASGELWSMSGGARSSLQWLRRQLADTAADLSPGDTVLTGTPLGLYPVREGDQAAVLIDDKVGALCSIV